MGGAGYTPLRAGFDYTRADMLRTPLHVSLFAVATSILSLACGDSPAPAGASASAEAKKSAAPPPATSGSAKVEASQLITIDEMGPYIAGERAKLKEPGGPEKLKKIVSGLKLDKMPLEVTAFKKSKFVDVLAVVHELAAAGATQIKIKGETRNDLPKEIVIVPELKLSETAAPCSVVAMITAKVETDVWAISGGTAKKHTKGMAGPDLSNAGESLKKDLKKCDSKVAFFSADETLEWEYAQMIAGAIQVNDEEKKVATLVLLDEVPVPGRPVKLKK